METKEMEKHLVNRFNSSNHFHLELNKLSKEYKYYENIINQMLESKKISLVDKIRNKLVFKYNHCYTNDLGIKQRCINQCDFCKNLQVQKENFLKSQSEKELKKIESNKLKTPSKFKQILTILFK